MNDEKIYQEAKKINTAVFQNIVYTQFMDALLGKSNELSLNDSIEGNQDFTFSTLPTQSVIKDY